MTKFGMLYKLLGATVILSQLCKGDSIEYNVSPPAGSLIVDYRGQVDISIQCEQFQTNSGNPTQVTTLWSYELVSNPGTVLLITSTTEIFEISGTARENPLPFPTYRNILTIMEITEEIDGATIFCGQGSVIQLAAWTIRIYHPPSLRDNLSVKVVEGDVNIPIDLSMSPVAFPVPVFQWSKDGINVDSSTDISYTYPTALFQNAIDRSASGMYSLTAVNYELNSAQLEVGRDTGNFILDVLFGPDITQGPLQHYVLVGEPISLVCGTSLESNPAATISWRDVQGQEIQNTGRYTFDNGPETVQLNFTITTAADSGAWGCSITVSDSDVMTASGGKLVHRNNAEIGLEMIESIMLTVVVPPSEPRLVRPDTISASQATFSWREPKDLGQPLLVSYEITADDLVNASIVYLTGNNGTVALTISDLLPGVLYQFTVRAITMGGDITARGIASTPVNHTTLISAPFPVCESVTSMNGNITISWSFKHTGGVALTAVKVFYTYTEGLNRVNGSEISIGTSDTSLVMPGLETGREYTFSVLAVNNVGSTESECIPVLHKEDYPGVTTPPNTIDDMGFELGTIMGGAIGGLAFVILVISIVSLVFWFYSSRVSVHNASEPLISHVNPSSSGQF